MKRVERIIQYGSPVNQNNSSTQLAMTPMDLNLTNARRVVVEKVVKGNAHYLNLGLKTCTRLQRQSLVDHASNFCTRR